MHGFESRHKNTYRAASDIRHNVGKKTTNKGEIYWVRHCMKDDDLLIAINVTGQVNLLEIPTTSFL